VPVHEHPDPLAFRVASVGLEHRPGAQAADFEGFLGPHGHIAPIGAGLDEDGVAVPGDASRVGDALDRATGADGDDIGEGGPADRGQQLGASQKMKNEMKKLIIILLTTGLFLLKIKYEMQNS